MLANSYSEIRHLFLESVRPRRARLHEPNQSTTLCVYDAVSPKSEVQGPKSGTRSQKRIFHNFTFVILHSSFVHSTFSPSISNHCSSGTGHKPKPNFPAREAIAYWLSIHKTKPNGPDGG